MVHHMVEYSLRNRYL